jgi:hypothetical protein
MRSPIASSAIALVIALPLVGCGDASSTEKQPTEAQDSASDSNADEATATRTSGPLTEASPSLANPVAAEAASGPLTEYVGKSTAEQVNGVDWNHNPTVLAGIRRAVTEPNVLEAIKDTSGPAALIELIDGKVASWACELHNCGVHQWMVMADPSSGATNVCYHDAAKLAGQSRWFLASGKLEVRPGNCTIE